MTPRMTDARREEMLKAGEKWENDAEVTSDDFYECKLPALEWGELRALLAEKTCEWTWEGDYTPAGYRTQCGLVVEIDTNNGRPCWCGGKVTVTK